MKIKIKLTPALDYTNPFNCSIAKSLRKVLIFSMIGPERFCGLFLGFIPIWGKISKEASEEAHKELGVNINKKVKFLLYR